MAILVCIQRQSIRKVVTQSHRSKGNYDSGVAGSHNSVINLLVISGDYREIAFVSGKSAALGRTFRDFSTLSNLRKSREN